MSNWAVKDAITRALAAVARWLSACFDTLRQAYASDDTGRRRDLAD